MPGLSNLDDIMGDRVSATTVDMITAPVNVKANSRNSEPVSPPCSPMGAYTAARTTVVAIMGPTSSRAPTSAA